MSAIERFASPQTVREAVELLAGEAGTILAGGTDLMLQTKSGARTFTALLLDISRIAELRNVARTNGSIRIGALCTVTDILGSKLLQDCAPILPETADCFAGGQIRNSATMGGNICNASPAGDMIIPLLLLDAEIELASWSEGKVTTRRMPLCDFFLAPGETAIQPKELVTGVSFAAPGPGFVAGFKKFGARPAMDIAVVSVGVAGTRSDGGLRQARVALGAVAPVPLRGRQTEAAIEGRPLDEANITDAARQAEAEISPISDVRASAWYRKELTRVLTKRLLLDVSQTGD